jgi:hypothetical protein
LAPRASVEGDGLSTWVLLAKQGRVCSVAITLFSGGQGI